MHNKSISPISKLLQILGCYTTHIVMMIAVKNVVMKIVIGATTIANAVIMIGLRDRGLHNHVAVDRKTSSTM